MITLYEFAMACYLFKNSTNYEETYRTFLNKTQRSIDLNNNNHLEALICWLKDWKCRTAGNFKPKIASWYNKFNNTLFPVNRELTKLSDSDLIEAFNSYKSLLEIDEIGETIASKILFAIRPNALVPWDNETRNNLRNKQIRNKLGITCQINSYRDYLNWLRSLVDELEKNCLSAGFQLVDLPKKVGADNDINMTMLLNEYIFIKFGSKNWQPPDIRMLKEWVNWS